jgi:hypothetical protein
MKRKFQLQIPEPCHEDWDKMTPVDKGRFCASCQKTVMDFTGMSDAQLVAFFKRPSTGSVCGRFVNDQLERDITIPRKRIPWLKYFFQIALPAFLVSQKTVAQGGIKISTGDTVELHDQCRFNQTVGEIREEVSENKIKGKVIDENGVGIPYASVYIKGTKTGASCDSAGNFQISPGIYKKSITLVISCIGFMQVEKIVAISAGFSAEIIIKSVPALSGEVVVTSSAGYKKGKFTTGAFSIRNKVSAFQKVKDFFIRDLVSIYPNPAKSDDVINIKWEKRELGEYRFDLFNLQGQLLRSETGLISENNQVVSFRLVSIAAGTYSIRMTNKKSGKQHTEKIIVQ